MDRRGGGGRVRRRARRAPGAGREEPRHVGGRALDCMGILAFFQNDLPRARQMYEDAIVNARTAGDLWCLADGLATLGSILPLVGDFERATAYATEGLELARREDDRQGIRMALFALALADARLGHLE